MDKGETRLKPIDSIRGISAVVVACMFHYQFVFDVIGERHPLHGVPILWTLTYYGGALVELFFIISGLLTYKVYYRSIYSYKTSFKEFVLKKVLRLFPMMYLAHILMAGMQWISLAITGTQFRGYNQDGVHFLYNLLGLQYAWFDLVENFNQASWYISVLLMCFLLFFLLCRIQRKWDIDFSNAGQEVGIGGGISYCFTGRIFSFSDGLAICHT